MLKLFTPFPVQDYLLSFLSWGSWRLGGSLKKFRYSTLRERLAANEWEGSKTRIKFFTIIPHLGLKPPLFKRSAFAIPLQFLSLSPFPFPLSPSSLRHQADKLIFANLQNLTF
jgi:hypothetical protein